MKTKNNKSAVDELLASLDKNQLAAFIRKECDHDTQFQERFLALGAGTLFIPDPSTYSSRIEDLIEDYGGKHGYVEYRDSFDFNRAVSRIYEEADDAIANRRWEVAVAILAGIADESEEILNCGDDSAGELGAIVDECFEKWMEIAGMDLPEEIKVHIFELALSKFRAKDLKGWDWWWSWMDIAIELADTPERQKEVLEALDEIKKPVTDDWSGNHAYNEARSYRMKMMARCGTPEERRQFMYDNIDNPEFRRKLLQSAFDEGNPDEALRIAKDGIAHDSKLPGLVSEWKEWEMRVYMKRDNVDNILRLAREFFLGGRGGRSFSLGETNDFSMEKMYALMKSKVAPSDWHDWMENLIKDSSKSEYQLLYLYTQEKLWDRYMEYLKSHPTRYGLEEAPKEVRNSYKEDFIRLYADCVEEHFYHASNRDAYRDGASMLTKLIKYGGKNIAKRIISEQKNRRPRRPALIDELSKITV